jgi:solute carrier family 25 citrate transporter 1
VQTVKEKGVFGIYKGMSALVLGNSLKAGVRFLGFENYKRGLQSLGIDSTSGLVLAGLGAGVTEAILVVTPSETIKTKLIHDQNSANPKFRGLVHGVKTIIAEEGIGGVYRGMGAVVARQGANSAVRMSSYGLLREKVSAFYQRDDGRLPAYATFILGACFN